MRTARSAARSQLSISSTTPGWSAAQARARHTRVGQSELARHRVDPACHRLGLAQVEQREPVVGNQLAHLGEITGRRRMPNRLVGITLRAVPCAGTPVQPGDKPGLGARKLQAQQIAEQVVVAEPLATVVETDQEQVRTLNLLQPADPV
jgi:hypothetical protein